MQIFLPVICLMQNRMIFQPVVPIGKDRIQPERRLRLHREPFLCPWQRNILYNSTTADWQKTQRPLSKCSSAPLKPFSLFWRNTRTTRKRFQRTFPSFRKSPKKHGKRKNSSNSSNPTLPPSTARSSSP